MKRLGVVLLSGGLDSTTLATWALRQGYELSAITVHYGQSHSREVDAARLVAQALGVRQQVVDVSFFRELAWYSSLTNPTEFAVPDDRQIAEMATQIPITYVPLRNSFFLTLAAACLESEALDRIERRGENPNDIEPTILVAANAIDYSGYPDCRPEFYVAMAESLRLGSKLGAQYDIRFRIDTPFIDKTKCDIVRLALDVGAPLKHTWSCYKGGERPCGRCDSCRLRAKGFCRFAKTSGHFCKNIRPVLRNV